MIEPTDQPEAEQPVVFVVDDDASMRAALEDLLESVSLNVRVFGSIAEFLEAERQDAPACLVLDVRMPGMTGLEFLRRMAEFNLQIPVVFITAHGDIPMSVEAMKAGAVDFLTKPFRDQDLIDAIHAALQQDTERREREHEIESLRARYALLTRGEREVLALIGRGLLNKQIAARLNLSEVTIKVRRSQLRKKLRARSVAELTRIIDRLSGADPEG